MYAGIFYTNSFYSVIKSSIVVYLFRFVGSSKCLALCLD